MGMTTFFSRKLWAFAFLFATLQSGAQEVLSFSDKPEKYFNDAENYVKRINRAETELVFKEFKTKFEQKKISELQFKKIVEASNTFLYEKLPLYPFYHNLWRVANIASDKQIKDDDFENAMMIMGQVIENQKQGNNNNLKNYLEFVVGLYESNALNVSQTRTWLTKSSDYLLKFENREPILYLKDADIIAISKNDTIKIKKTSGKFLPLKDIWYGKNGIVDWEKSKIPADKAYCSINRNYTLNMKDGEYTIDSVYLTYIPYLQQPAIGKLYDKLFSSIDTNRVTFPRFDTYENKFKIENFADGVTFFGGFSLYGSKIIGKGKVNNEAYFHFYKDGKNVITTRSLEYVIKPQESIASKNANVSIYFDNDSITHPGVNIKYAIKSKKIRFVRDPEAFGNMPFFSSFHNMEMNIDAILWDMNKQEIAFKMIGGGDQNPASFKSNNFFRNNDYAKIRGVTDYDPIFVMKLFVEETGRKEVGAEELTKRFNKNLSLNNTRTLFFTLAEEGYITYDKQNEIVYIKDKVTADALASIGKADYDVVKIKSISTKENGSFNFEDKIMNLRGVNRISVSDSQNVVFFPKNDSMKLMKNRDIEFNGNVFAGKVNFAGEKFDFVYDTFKVDLNHVDALTLHVEEADDVARKIKLIPLKSKIEDFDGELQIDEMNNKSGKEPYGEYPKMQALNEAKVYYDNILNGVYNREKFKFILKPFSIDSLDNYDPYNIDFDGKLISANIFPDIPEHLKIQPDLMLGFKTKTDENGLKLYGIATFKDSIILNSEGLKGKGNYDFVATNTKSNDILFYIDSLKSEVDSFIIKKETVAGVEFPQLNSTGKTHQRWYPYRDSMVVKKQKQKFDMFEKNGVLDANLLVTARNGLSANGQFDWNNAFIKSKKMKFRSDAVHADTSELKINALDSNKVAFSNKNVLADIDFSKKMASFKANNKSEKTELPYNQYITSLNEFDWDMNAQKITFKNANGTLANFLSTRKSQDSLQFLAKTADYDLNTSILNVYDIPFIKVGDAKIYPDSNTIAIEAEAKIQTLKNAKIITDTITNYHTIENVTCDIKGRNDYAASGEYTFAVKEVDQKIKFNNIRLEPIDIEQKKKKKKERILVTKADGTVTENDQFKLTPKLYYYGKVNLFGNEKNLYFDGYYKLDLNNYKNELDWVYVNKQVDPKTIAIPYDNPINPQKQELSVGYFLNKDLLELSTSLFFVKDKKATPIFEPKGMFLFDEQSQEFVFGDSTKVIGKVPYGDEMRYNDTKGTIQAVGKFPMGISFENEYMNFVGFGEGNYSLATNKFEFKQIQNYNFFAPLLFYTNAQKIFLEDAINLTDLSIIDKPYLEVNRQAYPNLGNTTDAKDKIISDFNTQSTFFRTKDTKTSLLLSNIEMVWDEFDNTFRSKGDKIGLVVIGESNINKFVKGYVELGPRKSGDFINIYLEASNGDYVYLNYMNNELEVLFSRPEMNTALLALKEKELSKKIGGGKNHTVRVSTESRKDNFKYRMIEANAPENQGVVGSKRKSADEFMEEQRIQDSIKMAEQMRLDSLNLAKQDSLKQSGKELKKPKENKKDEVKTEQTQERTTRENTDADAPPPGMSLQQIKMEIAREEAEKAAREKEKQEAEKARKEAEEQRAKEREEIERLRREAEQQNPTNDSIPPPNSDKP